MIAPVAAVALLAVLPGCTIALTAASFVGSGVTYALTDKSPADNALSLLTDSDCGLFNFVRGKPICHDRPKPFQFASLSSVSPAAGDGANAPAAGDTATGQAEPAYRVREGSTLVIDHLAARNVELVGFAPTDEFYALVQDDGALEIYVHDPSLRSNRANIRLVLRVDRYATDPDALEGITVGGVFKPIKDITV